MFDKERLKQIYLIESTKGNYCVRIKTLDRDSLKITTGQLFLAPETLKIVTGMGMQAIGSEGIMSLAGYN